MTEPPKTRYVPSRTKLPPPQPRADATACVLHPAAPLYLSDARWRCRECDAVVE